MKLFLLVLSATAVCCLNQSDPRFHIVNPGGRFQYQNSSEAQNFYNIEVEFIRFDNPDSITGTGSWCDNTDACDPRIQAYIETDQSKPWPDFSVGSTWTTVIERAQENSFPIGVSINQDVCGQTINEITARAYVHDIDAGSANDEIGRFTCTFPVRSNDIARDLQSAGWSSPHECVPLTQKGRIRLTARMRGYLIPQENCRIAG